MPFNQYIEDLLTYFEDYGAFETARHYRMSVTRVIQIYKQNYYDYRIDKQSLQ